MSSLLHTVCEQETRCWNGMGDRCLAARSKKCTISYQSLDTRYKSSSLCPGHSQTRANITNRAGGIHMPAWRAEVRRAEVRRVEVRRVEVRRVEVMRVEVRRVEVRRVEVMRVYVRRVEVGPAQATCVVVRCMCSG